MVQVCLVVVVYHTIIELTNPVVDGWVLVFLVCIVVVIYHTIQELKYATVEEWVIVVPVQLVMVRSTYTIQLYDS